jgi:hypothetical protein
VSVVTVSVLEDVDDGPVEAAAEPLAELECVAAVTLLEERAVGLAAHATGIVPSGHE